MMQSIRRGALSILRIATLLLAIALMATPSVRADEVSQRQEAIRAPARTAYIKAKRAEKDALDQRQKILDQLSAMLLASNRDLDRLNKERLETSNTLVAKRDERRQAAQALSLALGRAAGNALDPAVKAAQARLDALDTEVAALEKKLAGYDRAEQTKIAIPANNDLFAALRAASFDLDKARHDVVNKLAAYLIVLRPDPPPYLQSVQVYVGAKAMYRAEWRIDNQAADDGSYELTKRLDKILVDLIQGIGQIEDVRKEFAEQRSQLLVSLDKYSKEINQAADKIGYAGMMVVLLPALIEAAGVVIEVFVSGGSSTVERHAVEEGVKAGTTLLKGLTQKSAGQVLAAAEQASVNKLIKVTTSDAELQILQTFLAKKLPDMALNWKAEEKDQATSWRPSDLIDNTLRPGSSDATKVLVADVAEQVIGRSAKAGIAILTFKGVAGLAAASGESLGAWQAVQSGAANFYSAKTPLKDITGALKGTRSANILGLCITATKTVAAAYYGAQLGEAEDRFVLSNTLFDYAYHSYYLLLMAERILLEKQRALQDLYFQATALRLQSAGPRTLAVLANEGNNDATETLTFALRFSQPLDRPPQVRIAGLVIDMTPQGVDDKGRATHWEGKLAARKLPDTLSEGVLEVSPGLGSRPYATFDANPASPARFIVPEALDQPLPDREEWADYERGGDRNHRITFHAPKLQQDVPWRGASTCDKIDCDCGAVPVASGLGGDVQRTTCQAVEQGLRRECLARKQTYAACPPGAGPAAYPPPVR
jgi:hypothetical protein